MKRLCLPFIFFIVCLGIISCRSKKRGVVVEVTGNKDFPGYLAGRWKADEFEWEIVFDSSGEICSIVHNMGGVEIKPGEVTRFPLRKGGEGIFEPGQWFINYDVAERELMVKITLDNIYMELGEDVLEDERTDIFMGRISEQNDLWQVSWASFPSYVIHTDKYPNFRMSADPNYGVTKVLSFQKVSEQ